ncbi:hypothetical protein F2Q69_00036025 [Brassica cretica]|nr:hypothetical protein F2Q69_00036025 [Brassica cretica]
MVKTPVAVTGKAPSARSQRRQSGPVLSTPSSSSAPKRSRKKKKISDQRQPWLRECYLPLTPATLLGGISELDRLNATKKHPRKKKLQSPQQDIQYNQDTILPVQVEDINVGDLERVNTRTARALRMERLITKRVATANKSTSANPSAGIPLV